MRKGAGCVVWLGYTIDERELYWILDNDAHMPIQTYRFGWSVVSALTTARVSVRLIATAPVANFPRNAKVVFTGRRFTQEGHRVVQPGFVNLLGLKQLTRSMTLLPPVLQMSRKGTDAILVHGTDTALLAVALFCRMASGVPVIPVVTDPPTRFFDHDRWHRRILKRLNDRLVRRLLRTVDGAVVLAHSIAEDFLPGRPFLVMEGICPESHLRLEPEAFAAGSRTDALRIVYTGGLLEEYGIQSLVDAVDALARQGLLVELHLYGRGPWEEQAAELPTASHVVLHGVVKPDDVPGILREADILINPRPIGQEFVRYSFPSKTLEYLASGTVTISTDLPSIPAEYAPHLVSAGDGSPEAVMAAIRQCHDLGESGRAAFGRAARDFVISMKSEHAQGARLQRFVTRLARKQGTAKGSDRTDDPHDTRYSDRHGRAADSSSAGSAESAEVHAEQGGRKTSLPVPNRPDLRDAGTLPPTTTN